ncbi:midasin-like isoform X2 [Zophobas morio]|uniref:midasin-like isoform X2 n=1 Tax=Zophobas morio TaxID=2755281 RepID=UPI003082B0C4
MKRANEQALFKLKNKSFILESEEALEMKEFHKKFPSYRNVYSEFLSVPTEDDAESLHDHEDVEKESTECDALVITERDIVFICQSYCLFSTAFYNSFYLGRHDDIFACLNFEDLIKEGCMLAYHLIKDSFSSDVPCLHDKQSVSPAYSVHLIMIHNYINSTEMTCGKPLLLEPPRSFYETANRTEALKLLPILKKFKKTVCLLLSQWPDHPSLCQILSLIGRILSHNLSSPLMKFLTGLEILLQKAHEWEEYASKDVSLSIHINAISQIILHWRQLEMHDWPLALDHKLFEFERASMRLFFDVYEAVQHGVRGEGSVDLSAVFYWLNEFLNTSPVGGYSMRLEILRGFYFSMKVSALSGSLPFSSQKNLHQMMDLLYNLIELHSSSLQKIKRWIVSQRAPFEEKLKTICQLAKWYDVNYWVVIESGQKTHKQLHTCTVQFGRILKRPVSEVLKELVSCESSDELENEHGNEKSIRECTSDFSMSGKSEDIIELTAFLPDHQLRVSDAIFAKVLSCLVHFRQHDESLKKKAHPPSLKEKTSEQEVEFASLSKQAKVHKRKTLTDLLRMLSFLGFSSQSVEARKQSYESVVFCSSHDLNDSLLLLRSCIDAQSDSTKQLCSFLGNNEHLQDSLAKGTKYYYECVCQMFATRQSAESGCGSDLRADEISKCKGFSEFGVLLLSKQRKLLSLLAPSLSRLITAVCMLDKVSPLLRNTPSQIFTLSHLLDLLTFEGNMNQALFETERVLHCARDLIDPAELVAFDAVTKVFADTFKPSLHALISSLPSFGGFSMELLVAPNSHELFQRCFTIVETQLYPKLLSYESLRTFGPSLLLIAQQWKSSSPIVKHKSSTNPNIVYTTLEGIAHAILVRLKAVRTHLLERLTSFTGDSAIEEEEFLKHQILLLQKNFNIIGKHFDIAVICGKVHEFLQQLKVIVDEIQCNRLRKDLIKQLILLIKKLYSGLSSYISLVGSVYYKLALFHMSFGKMHKLLLNLFYELLVKGFCIPENAQLAESSETRGGKEAGIGEGEGEKNVSGEIDDAEQVLGTEGTRNTDDNEPTNVDEEEGIEMNYDFEGKLFDMTPMSDEVDENQSEFDESNAEDEIGPVEQELVDKHMAPADLEASPHHDSRHSPQQFDELGQTEPETQPELTAKEYESEVEGVSNEEHMDSDSSNAAEISDESALLDEEEKLLEEDIQGSGEDDAELSMVEAASSDKPTPLEDANDEVVNENSLVCSKESEREALDEHEKGVPVDEKENCSSLEAGTPNMTSAGQAQRSEEQERSIEHKSGSPLAQPADHNAKQGEVAAPYDWPRESHRSGNNLYGKQNYNAGENNPINEPSKKDLNVNPFRSVGDAAKNWMERARVFDMETNELENILDASEQKNCNKCDSHEYSYISENFPLRDDDKQVLSSASKEQAEYSSKNQAEPEENASDARNFDIELLSGTNELKMEVDESSMLPALKELEVNRSDQHNAGKLSRIFTESEKTFEDIVDREGVPTDLLNENIKAENKILNAEENQHQQSLEQEDATEQLSAKLEGALVNWRKRYQQNESQQSQARAVWKKYDSLTQHAAQDLCEQLRIILEPSLATKLKGDYKTGKRLNMRRIIPYIASQYKKDKIWLRRTKPSKRAYQVLLTIDDSESMSDSCSTALAFESLCLLSKALTLLEVGELCVMSFSDSVRLLHPFYEPFTEENGAAIVSQLSFTEGTTNFSQMLTTSLNFLKSSSRKSHLPVSQLQFIISDGICPDLEAVHQRVVESVNAGVLLVFIIVDNPQVKQHSIMDIKTVTYPRGKLKISSYLDLFPFPYYVILRNVSALPSILADALRQWFELFSSQ